MFDYFTTIARFDDLLVNSEEPKSILDNCNFSPYTYGGMLNDLNDRYLSKDWQHENAIRVARTVGNKTFQVLDTAMDIGEKGIEQLTDAFEASYPPTRCLATGCIFGGSGLPQDPTPCGCITICANTCIGLNDTFLEQSPIYEDHDFPQWKPRIFDMNDQDFIRGLNKDIFLQTIRNNAVVKNGIFRSTRVNDIIQQDLKNFKPPK